MALQVFDGLGRVGGLEDRKTAALQIIHDTEPYERFVLDDEHDEGNTYFPDVVICTGHETTTTPATWPLQDFAYFAPTWAAMRRQRLWRL